MDQELSQKFTEQNKKLDQIYTSIEKMQKYFLWTLIITIAMIVLPLIGLVFAIPFFLSTFSSAYGF